MSEVKKKLFTVQSPYADYAADNDMISVEMEGQADGEEIKPDMKQLVKTALTAAVTVVIFVLGVLIYTAVGSCIQDRILPSMNASVSGYSLSQDGSGLTVEFVVTDSINYVLAYDTELKGNALYVTPCNSAGLFREKADEPNIITLYPENGVSEIWFRCGQEFVLEFVRDGVTGEWKRADHQ